MARHFGMAFAVLFQFLFLISCFGLIDELAAAPKATNIATTGNLTALERRQLSATEMSTCGYYTGDIDKPRTANSGYNCRVDTQNGLWGFCPTTVISARDCGLAGSCIDEEDCKNGCGKTAQRSLTTFTCTGKQVCSTALLDFGVDQTYSYIACGDSATKEIYLANASSDSTTDVDDSSFTASNTRAEPMQRSTTPTTSITGDEIKLVPDTRSIGKTAQKSNVKTESTDVAAEDSDEPSPEDGGVPIGPIVGGVIGGLVIICGTVIAVVCIRRTNQRKAKQEDGDQRSQRWAEFSYYAPPEHSKNGGWGPHELPAGPTSRSVQSPVELGA